MTLCYETLQKRKMTDRFILFSIQMALDVVLMGLCNLLPPFTGSLAGLIGACVLAGATRGFFSAGNICYKEYNM